MVYCLGMCICMNSAHDVEYMYTCVGGSYNVSICYDLDEFVCVCFHARVWNVHIYAQLRLHV
jgi:hypothetical protein